MWSRFMFWLAVSLTFGMAVAYALIELVAWSERVLLWLVGGLFVLSCFSSLFWLRKRQHQISDWAGEERARLEVLFRFSLLVVCMSLGAFWYTLHDMQNTTQIRTDAGEVRLMGFIAAPVVIDGDRVSLQVDSRLVNEQIVAERLQVVIRLKTEQEQRECHTWMRGQYISLTGEMTRPDGMRNQGGFDYRQYLRQKQIHYLLRTKSLDSVQVAESSWNTYHLLRAVDQSRDAMGAVIDQHYREPHAGFLKGILIGYRDAMDPEQYRQFSLIGLTHIIAISGLNVGIFVLLCLFVLRFLPFTRERSMQLVICLIPAYILLTGASPSVVRAGLMAMIALFAASIHQWKDGLAVISLTAAAMLFYNPYMLVDIGFQLSFLVTLGLLIGVPYMNRLLPNAMPEWLKGALSVTTVAQLASFPLSIYYFNQFSLLSWFANLLLVPFASLLIYPLGLLSMVVGLFSGTVAGWIAIPVTWLNRGLFAAVDTLSRIDGTQLLIGTPNLLWIPAYYICLALIIYFLMKYTRSGRQTPRNLMAAGSGSLLMLVLLLSLYWPPSFAEKGTVAFFDVGQGDAALIRTPSGVHVLIDGGGSFQFGKKEPWQIRRDPFEVGRDVLVPLLKKRGVHQLDWVIASHQDADHIGGLQAVLEEIPVRRLLFNGTLKPVEGARELFQTALDKQVDLYEAQAGEQISLDQTSKMDILWPLSIGEQTAIETEQNQNEHSLVMMFTMLNKRFLFAGDIDAAREKQILAAYQQRSPTALPQLNVLKVAHHGSKTSTSSELLEAFQPKVAVISAGRNNVYGHPHHTVTERLEQKGADVYRTDQSGEITVTVGEERMFIVRTVES